MRPSWKERYPLTPIERYVTWRRDDGTLLDPWMRLHERLGARVGPPLPESMLITGTVAEWSSWTGLAFPDPGPTSSRMGSRRLFIEADVGALLGAQRVDDSSGDRGLESSRGVAAGGLAAAHDGRRRSNA